MSGCEFSLQNVQLCRGRHRVGGEAASELSQEREVGGRGSQAEGTATATS